MDEEIFVKLPVVIEWIDNFLAEHAHKTWTVADFRFSRLPLYFTANLRPGEGGGASKSANPTFVNNGFGSI